MLRFLSFGFVLGAAFGCTEVVRTCNNCYLDLPSPSHCVTTEGPNVPQATCIGNLNNNIGIVAVTWNAVLMGQSNYCKQLNCDHDFLPSGLNTITYTKSCNAGCNSTTLTRTTNTRVASTETYVNMTSATLSACVNMCIEIAYTGKKCTVSHSGNSCYLYEDSTCTGGSCDSQSASTWTLVVVQCDFTVCPGLTNPANGVVNMSGLAVGSTASFSCNTGYVRSGSQTLTCQAAGTWSSVSPTCLAVSCGTPNALSNGTVSAPLTTYLSTATFSCDSGYNLSGQSSTICQANGTWSGTFPTCNLVNCGTPSAPTNGNFSAIATTYLSTATYSCNSGYTMTGQNTTACQATGTWSGTLPTCLPISCETPSAPLNGSFYAPVTTYLATATFTCDLGYSLSGQNSSTCQANGMWSGTLPTCFPVSCGSSSAISNGNFSASETIYLATGVFSCNLGYILSGQNSTICQADGTWSGTLPTCNPVDCGTPPVPMSCNFTASGTTYLQSVVYTCYSGYLLIGEKNSTCQANMTWSGSIPTCQPVDCGQPSGPSNGSVLATNTTYLHEALYECNFGYRLEGHNSSLCLSNGSWSNSLPSCVFIDCTVPAPPMNGSVNSTGTIYMARVDYYCDRGYNLIGHSERFCRNDDTWNGTDPHCDPVDCGNRTAPINGSVNLSGTTYLNSAIYQCDSGFLLNGQNTTECQADGSWNVDVPFCDPVDCGNLTDPVSGIVSVTDTTYTSVASYQCNFGYRLDGENMTECLSNGRWSNAKPNCTMIGCGPLNNPENGFVSMQEGTDVGARANYSCKPGYKLSNLNGRICAVNNQWTGKEPTCDVRVYKKLYIMPCICYPNKTFTGMTMEEILQKLKTDTAINPKKTTAAINKLESAYDPRVSSRLLGALGVSVLCVVFGLMFCVDFINVYIHFKENKSKK